MKGQSFFTRYALGVALMLLVVAALFIVISNTLTGELDIEEQRCRSSIEQHSLAVRSTAGGTDTPILCSPTQETISADEKKARKQLADLLVFCWDRWQRGEVELFRTEGTYCNPCSILAFEEPGEELTGLDSYLDRPYKNGTYREYLYSYTTDGLPAEKQRPTGGTVLPERLTPNGQYSIVFVHDKGHSIKQYAEMLSRLDQNPASVTSRVTQDIALGTGTGAAVGAATGAILIVGACTVITGGICGLIVTGGAIAAGVGVGGYVGFKTGVANGLEYPEWVSMVMFVPHDGTEYVALGCTEIFQEGVPERVDNAENI